MALHEQQQGLIKTHLMADMVDKDHDEDGTPRTLRESAPSLFWRSGIPTLLLVIPLVYVGLISMVLYLDKREQSGFGDNILELLQIASTIWPISFAAVMGPFLKTLALHNAEKGSVLGYLEFLLTSQTTVAAVRNLFTIRHVQAWTVGIALVWCLSPLGGQAALRSLSLQPSSISLDAPAVYYLGGNVSDMNMFYEGGGGTDFGLFGGASIQSSLISNMRSAIVASFYTPAVLASHSNGSSNKFDAAVETLGGPQQAARLGQRDLWRNVRIPFMELLPAYNAREPGTWIPVPSEMVVPYASLIGVPIRGGSFGRAGNSSLTVQSHYQTLSCGEDFDGTAWVQNGSTKLLYHNTSASTHVLAQYQGLAETRARPNVFLDVVNNTVAVAQHLHLLGYPVTEPSSKLELIIGGRCYREKKTDSVIMLRTCKMSTSYIDMQVNCTRLGSLGDLNCQAERVRHTPGFPISGSLTALSSVRTMGGIIWEMPFTTASYHNGEPSNLEKYLKDPPSQFEQFGSGLGLNSLPGCFSNVSSRIFSVRLATALNTFVMAMYNTTVLTGADGTRLENRNRMWKHSTAKWTEFSASVYVLNEYWFSIWLVSTVTLLVCAAVAIALRCLIRAPDFLDSVAGLTRDSPFIVLPQGVSGMSGSDRLQEVKKVKVKICDVRPDADVGRIALTTTVNDSKLDWRRRYS